MSCLVQGYRWLARKGPLERCELVSRYLIVDKNQCSLLSKSAAHKQPR
jgi:hypothetical protein